MSSRQDDLVKVLGAATGDLQNLHMTAEKLVNEWYPKLAKSSPREYRVSVQSLMGQLLRMMELRTPRY